MGFWSAMLYNSYAATTQNVFCLDGTNRKRIEGTTVYEWGIDAPTEKPVIAAGASTGLTGDYNAKYSYARKSGTTVICESNLSPAADAAVSLSNQSMSITWTASSDSQVTHVRVYRTLTDGLLYYHDQDIAIGTVTVDTTTADGSLGSAEHTDHDRPPAGTYVAGPSYNGTCFIIYNNLMYYCKPKQPEYWPDNYFIEVSPIQFPGQLILFHQGQPYFLSKAEIYFIQGTGAETFFPTAMKALTGAQGTRAACSVYGWGIFHVGPDGIYLFSDTDTCITQANFQPIFRGQPSNGMAGAVHLDNSWILNFQNRVYFGYPGCHGDYTYCHSWEESEGYLDGTGFDFTTEDDTFTSRNCFSWEEARSSDTDYDYTTVRTCANDFPQQMLVFNLDTKRATYYTFHAEMRAATVDYYNNRLLIGDEFGWIWHFENKEAIVDGTGNNVSWEVESKEFTLQTRAHFPRWTKYDVDASDDDCSATGYLVLDGAVHQTHALSGNRITKRRLVAPGNGKRCSTRLNGTGPVKIYAVETE